MNISSNPFRIGTKAISNLPITNMDKDFEHVVTKVVQMAQKRGTKGQSLKLRRIISNLVYGLFQMCRL